MRPARWSLVFLIAAIACRDALVQSLPLVETPPLRPGEPLAVFVSGDGGWRAIDRRIAQGLHLAAFLRRRTLQEAAAALQEIVERYSAAWHAPKVIVVGYSRGAGVLPFMINRLEPRWRNRIAVVALLGLEPTIDFQMTPLPTREIPVRGEIERLRGKRVLCFYGLNERDSLCRELSPGLAIAIAEPGAHHFNGNYDDLARTIWRWTRT